MELIKSLVDYGVIGGLLIMSIIAFGIAIERFSFTADAAFKKNVFIALSY